MKKTKVEVTRYTINEQEALTIKNCLAYCKYRIVMHEKYFKLDLRKIEKLLKELNKTYE